MIAAALCDRDLLYLTQTCTGLAEIGGRILCRRHGLKPPTGRALLLVEIEGSTYRYLGTWTRSWSRSQEHQPTQFAVCLLDSSCSRSALRYLRHFLGSLSPRHTVRRLACIYTGEITFDTALDAIVGVSRIRGCHSVGLTLSHCAVYPYATSNAMPARVDVPTKPAKLLGLLHDLTLSNLPFSSSQWDTLLSSIEAPRLRNLRIDGCKTIAAASRFIRRHPEIEAVTFRHYKSVLLQSRLEMPGIEQFCGAVAQVNSLLGQVASPPCLRHLQIHLRPGTGAAIDGSIAKAVALVEICGTVLFLQVYHTAESVSRPPPTLLLTRRSGTRPFHLIVELDQADDERIMV